MKRLPDWVIYEAISDTLIIQGKRYSACFFGPTGLGGVDGTVLQLVFSRPDVVCVRALAPALTGPLTRVFLVRDVAELLGSDVPTVCKVLADLGVPGSTNTAIDPEIALEVARRLKACEGEASFAAANQPDRKPLSPEQIEAIHRATWMQSTATLADFARAIESAHGIGTKGADAS